MVLMGRDRERELVNAYSCMFVNVFTKMRTAQLYSYLNYIAT